ncbi:hypothetical protein Hanom_Chr10g00892341 [Helianthus anomalus]
MSLPPTGDGSGSVAHHLLGSSLSLPTSLSRLVPLSRRHRRLFPFPVRTTHRRHPPQSRRLWWWLFLQNPCSSGLLSPPSGATTNHGGRLNIIE